METVSKNKRGRPTVAKRLDIEQLFAMIKQDDQYESERSYTNEIYWQEGMSIIRQLFPDEGNGYNDFISGFFFSKGRRKRACIVEQIGRMSAQNGFNDADCKAVAATAIQYVKDGYTVREVERWIRGVRNGK